ncbi:hypothetical protein [Mycobacterium sp.]|uniref:hypothetical protein n=1 Tax=Mycobacterium sp. TaxID=1785 RepID=UPI002DA08833|nr:hypothetical protein [Mycobacterium sp.]
MLSTFTTTGFGVDDESGEAVEAAELAVLETGGELTRTGLSGSDATVRGRTTVFVLVAVGFSVGFDPRSDTSASRLAVVGVGFEVGVGVAVADGSAVGSGLGSASSTSSGVS